MLKSLLRILLLVVLIALPLALGFLYYRHTVLPDPDTRIEATTPEPVSDEEVLELYK
jgi:hypothetical protein